MEIEKLTEVDDCHDDAGFSLMELFLVVIIISLIMTFIIPKLIQLRIESKYEIIRQSCTEVAAAVEQWVTKSMAAQDDQDSNVTIADYVATLADREAVSDIFEQPVVYSGQWVATARRPNNWNNNNIRHGIDGQRVPVHGRWIAKKKNVPPESVVEDMISEFREIKNPFNEKNIFSIENDPVLHNKAIPGALAFASNLENKKLTYSFCFQGNDSTTVELELDTTFHAHQSILSDDGIKHCILFASYR